MRATDILESSLYAPDLEAAARFYAEVLGLEEVSRVAGRHVFFRCGERMLLIFDPERTREAGGEVPAHGARGPGHVAFVAREEELAGWRAHLERHGVGVEAEVTWPGGGRSLYFRDPAGNSLELAPPAMWGL